MTKRVLVESKGEQPAKRAKTEEWAVPMRKQSELAFKGVTYFLGQVLKRGDFSWYIKSVNSEGEIKVHEDLKIPFTHSIVGCIVSDGMIHVMCLEFGTYSVWKFDAETMQFTTVTLDIEGLEKNDTVATLHPGRELYYSYVKSERAGIYQLAWPRSEQGTVRVKVQRMVFVCKEGAIPGLAPYEGSCSDDEETDSDEEE